MWQAPSGNEPPDRFEGSIFGIKRILVCNGVLLDTSHCSVLSVGFIFQSLNKKSMRREGRFKDKDLMSKSFNWMCFLDPPETIFPCIVLYNIYIYIYVGHPNCSLIHLTAG